MSHARAAQNFPIKRADTPTTDATALDSATGALRELPTAQTFTTPSPIAEPLQVDATGALWLTIGLPKLHRRSLRLMASETSEGAAISGTSGAAPPTAGAEEAVWARLVATLDSNDGMVGLVSEGAASKKAAGRSTTAGSLNGRPVCVVGGTSSFSILATSRAPCAPARSLMITTGARCGHTERLLVAMVLENPLQVPLILQNVQLQARYRRHDIVVQKDPISESQSVSLRPASDTAASPSAGSGNRGDDSAGWNVSEQPGRGQDQPFTVDALEQVVLNPGERTQVGAAPSPTPHPPSHGFLGPQHSDCAVAPRAAPDLLHAHAAERGRRGRPRVYLPAERRHPRAASFFVSRTAGRWSRRRDRPRALADCHGRDAAAGHPDVHHAQALAPLWRGPQGDRHLQQPGCCAAHQLARRLPASAHLRLWAGGRSRAPAFRRGHCIGRRSAERTCSPGWPRRCIPAHCASPYLARSPHLHPTQFITDPLFTSVVDANNGLFDPAVQTLALDAALLPGASITLPLWIRSNNPGQVVAAMLFHYASEVRPPHP